VTAERRVAPILVVKVDLMSTPDAQDAACPPMSIGAVAELTGSPAAQVKRQAKYLARRNK
jgi:hypothetical protein